MTTRRDHALVIGASMAGLLAARVLGEHFSTVTVIDRDTLPIAWENRRGVPQGWHVHVLLPRGRQTVERLFPGFTDAMYSAGAPVSADLAAVRFEVNGHLLCQRPHQLPEPVVQASRRYLEGWVRAQVATCANVVLRDRTTVVGPLHDDARNRVTGLHLATEEGTETLAADLVVDTSGKGARTPAWLEQLGYRRPAEDELRVRLTYLSQQLRLAPAADVEPLVLYGMRPGRPQVCALFGYEEDTSTWTVGSLGETPPEAERGALLEAVRPWLPSDVYDAIAAATPLNDPVAYRYPTSRRRRYDRLRRFPEGLLVAGDAVCSFNPIYGRGMTVAAIEADLLDDLLARTRPSDPLARRWFRAIAKPVGVAWQLAVGADLALPEVEGPRPLPVRMVNAWVDRVLAAAETDSGVAERFLRVSGLLDPPSTLMTPRVMASVLGGSRRRTASSAPAPRLTAWPRPRRSGSSMPIG